MTLAHLIATDLSWGAVLLAELAGVLAVLALIPPHLAIALLAALVDWLDVFRVGWGAVLRRAFA